MPVSVKFEFLIAGHWVDCCPLRRWNRVVFLFSETPVRIYQTTYQMPATMGCHRVSLNILNMEQRENKTFTFWDCVYVLYFMLRNSLLNVKSVKDSSFIKAGCCTRIGSTCTKIKHLITFTAEPKTKLNRNLTSNATPKHADEYKKKYSDSALTVRTSHKIMWLARTTTQYTTKPF